MAIHVVYSLRLECLAWLVPLSSKWRATLVPTSTPFGVNYLPIGNQLENESCIRLYTGCKALVRGVFEDEVGSNERKEGAPTSFRHDWKLCGASRPRGVTAPCWPR